MKYIALIYMNPETATPPNTPEFGKMMAGYQTATETYKKDGVWMAGDALQPVTTATTVRVRNGKTESMDGPFAETKEQLGGFYMLDCANLDDAIRYAAMIPHAANGSVEIRPIMVFDY
ncbi:MAG: YciI family protein [Rhizobium sp.]|nr:YciI family protein [Rhizobium sp.]